MKVTATPLARTTRRSKARYVLVTVFAIALSLGAAPAFAQPVTHSTQQANLVDVFVDVLPTCEGDAPLYTFTTTTNRAEESTTFDDGRISGGINQTGTFSAVPVADPTLPSYTGTVTLRNTFYLQSDGLVTTTFTYTVHGDGSDGSTFSTHVTTHTNVRPDATINGFFRCH
jgi:hypothetical protein